LLIDRLMAAGHEEPAAFRIALGGFGLCCVLSYLWYGWPPRRWRDDAQGQ
jgi:hypothetical protein